MEPSGAHPPADDRVGADIDIRPLEKAYLEDARRLHNDPAILDRLTDATPVSEMQQDAWFASMSTSATSRRFMIVCRNTGVLLGVFRVDALDTRNGSACIGCDVDPRYQRRGIAARTFRHFFRYFFETCRLNRLYLETMASNEPAVALYRKLGMVEEGRSAEAIYRGGSYHDLIHFRLLKREYEAAAAA